jgi:UDP-N-acetylmuramate--alanine ligase
MTHVHLIGIGGSGLSAIARVLMERGEVVSGSDRQETPFAQELQSAGARIYFGHHPNNIAGADIVIRSSAVTEDNVEVRAAKVLGIPVYKRSEFLGQLMEGYQVIAVAGTHGKTTTTAMIAWMLTELGQDPSYIIGGISGNLKTNAHAGQGRYFVIEADEYDGMFLGLRPDIAIVTNVEHDHPDCYPTPEDFYLAFQQFLDRLTPGGVVVGCVDDPQTRRLLQSARQDGIEVRSYGINRLTHDVLPDYFGQGLSPKAGSGFIFEVLIQAQATEGQKRMKASLQAPGRHNVLNALATFAVADILDLPLKQASQILSEFRGTSRRFEIIGEVSGVTIIDDYAHHPTEIRATLSAARARYPEHEVWTVWQPHTYSRTRKLFDEFVLSFKETDHLLVTDVYAAREDAPANGFNSKKLVDAMAHPDVRYVSDFDQAVDMLTENLGTKNILLVLSAGDADQISARVFEAIRASN